ncbi:MAG: hypothetical protein Q8942_11785 [Bacillota bacterium]|nr:hypothetical protein [Bacillota bacterium]
MNNNRVKGILTIVVVIILLIVAIRIVNTIFRLLLPLIILGLIGFGVYYLVKKKR